MKILKMLLFIFFFAGLMALGALVKIPTQPVPITLQALFAILSGALLGPELGALSQIVYVVAGLWGLPIFESGGGLSYVFQPTFGYLIGFIVAAFVTGKMLEIRASTTAVRNVFSLLAIILVISIAFLTVNLISENSGAAIGSILVGALFLTFILWVLYLIGLNALRKVSEYNSIIESFWVYFSMLAGLAVIYLFGVSYLFVNANFILMTHSSPGDVIFLGMGKLLPWDLIKIVIAAYLAKELSPTFNF